MPGQQREDCELELATNLREVFKIMEKAPIKTFSWLKAPTNLFTFTTMLNRPLNLVSRNEIEMPTQRS